MDKKYIILIVLGGLIVVLAIVYFILANRPAPVTGPTVLNVVSSIEDEKYLKQIFNLFETQNNVKINFIKKDKDDYETESLNMVATGGIDVWGIPNSWIYKHLNKLYPYSGSSVNVIENYKNRYPELAVNENIQNEKIYGYPLSFDSLALYRSQTALEEILASTTLKESERTLMDKFLTWEDIEAQIPLLYKNRQDIALMAAGLPNQESASDVLTCLLLQQGTKMTDDSNKLATFHTSTNQLNGPDYPGAIALNRLNNFNLKYPNSLGEPLQAFIDGKVFYLIDYTSKSNQIKIKNPKLQFDLYDIPQLKQMQDKTTFVTYETYTVPQSSKNKDLAWKLILYLQDQNSLSTYRNLSAKSVFIKTENAYESLNYRALDNAKNWHNPDKIATDKIFINTITDTLAGKSAQTALDGAAVEVTKLLEKLQ